MRLAVLLALLACGGPISRPGADRSAGARVQRPPLNAPPDPIGTHRPGDRSCTENRDCKRGDLCLAPDTPPPGSPPPQCQSDAHCGEGGQVCTDGSCVPPCTPASCAAGRECRAGGHCALIACTDARAAACAQNFRCNPATGACERMPCTSRSQCDVGACFQARCFAHDAYCARPSQEPR